MVRFKFLLLSMLCLLFFAQSCIHGDLDDCPPMVRYAVAFEYTNHTGTNDRFYDDVKKINLYVFDENGLIFTTVTELSPYEKNFNIPLDNIPMGNYDIIAWGNVLDNGDFNFPKAITKGTSFDETRLYLQREMNNYSDEELDKLFYGILRDVEIPLYVSRTDTMPLINNTNKLRIVLHWDHSEEINSQNGGIIDYSNISVGLSASNAEYGFNNNFTSTNNVNYLPWAYYSTDSILKADNNKWLTMYYYSDSIKEVTNSCVYDLSILRMAVGSPIYLTVVNEGANLPENRNLLGNPLDVIQTFIAYFDGEGVSASQRQNMFDKNEYYRIDIYLAYNKWTNTYFSGTLHSLPWKLIPQPEVPMN